MRRGLRLLIVAAAMVLAGQAQAQAQAQAPTQTPAMARGHDACFARKGIAADQLRLQRWVVVLLDETTPFAPAHQAEILRQLEPLVQPGTGLKVLRFSAFLTDRNMAETVDVRVPAPLDEAVRHDMRKDLVKDFDLCQLLAQRNGQWALRRELQAYFGHASADVPRSEILLALKSVGDAVLPRLKAAQLRLVVVSDMLEHSDFGSFYGRGAPRRLDPAAEMARVKARNLSTDLRGARVYVMGAGLLPPGSPPHAGYRSGEVMTSLQAFWSRYVEESNGRLAGFGMPMLLTPITGE